MNGLELSFSIIFAFASMSVVSDALVISFIIFYEAGFQKKIFTVKYRKDFFF